MVLVYSLICLRWSSFSVVFLPIRTDYSTLVHIVHNGFTSSTASFDTRERLLQIHLACTVYYSVPGGLQHYQQLIRFNAPVETYGIHYHLWYPEDGIQRQA